MNSVHHRPVFAQHIRILQHPPVIRISQPALVNSRLRQAVHSNTRHSTHGKHAGHSIALLQHTADPERDDIQALLPINNLAPIHRLEQPLLRRALDPPGISPQPKTAELVLLRAPKAHKDEPERVNIARRLRRHILRRADPRKLLRRLNRVRDSRLLGFFKAGVGVDWRAQSPDAAADTPAAEALKEVVRQVVEVVVLHLRHFGVRAVLFVEGAAGQAVDVLDRAVREALLEDFGADEAGRAG